MDILIGSVERITYYNPENGYSVVRLKPEKEPHGARIPVNPKDGLVTVTGNLPELSPGENLRLQGRWITHSKHGLQFQSEFCEQAMPATVAGIRRYLGSGMIKGIGPRLAEKIVDAFGKDTLDVIEQYPEKLRKVPDIGPKRSQIIAAAWEEQKQVKEIMLFLHSYGVSTNLAIKIYKQYGDSSIDLVKKDPYRLARDIHGIGFKTADKIARALGLSPEHPSRIEAGTVFVLNEMTDEGHVYSPREELVKRATALLEISEELVEPAIERLEVDDRVRIDHIPAADPAIGSNEQPRLGEAPGAYNLPAVYLTPMFMGERNVAARLKILAGTRRTTGVPSPAVVRQLVDQAAAKNNLSLAQKMAIETALMNPLSVLTGGPGTGKTTALKALITLLEANRWRYGFASPTGRAAKRLAEATGRPASTIHRLLNFKPGEGFKYNDKNPLPLDFLVLDEASMLDLILANHLLRAVRPGAHLLLVGDVDQLPSVGAGDVLRDVIDSGIAPVTSLTEIFRQAAGSQIITNAHLINQGQMPVFSGGAESGDGEDFFLFSAETPQGAANWVQEVVCERIPRKFGLMPSDIQVLAPMYRGPVGVNALNLSLQAALNPPDERKPEKSLFGQIFRKGDKVMQLQNNYDKDVFNGDIGLIRSVDHVDHILSVDYDGRSVDYDWTEADQLTLAYAVSVHKAQGSEFPAVVVPVVTSHYMMLQRNLLYTAVTRAKKLCVLVGSRKAIWIAVRNDKVSHRYTALDWRLKD